jgi:ABC-type sugar transport system ATPase subunit
MIEGEFFMLLGRLVAAKLMTLRMMAGLESANIR